MERAGSDLTAFGETVVFLDYFKDLPDPRQAGKVIYPLPEVLLLCLLAVLAGQGNRVKGLCGEEAFEEVVVPSCGFSFEAQ